MESVYEACLAYEIRKRGLKVETQIALPVIYEGVHIDAGLRMDMLVEKCVIVELKSVDTMNPVFEAQLLTYLKLANIRLGYFINFNVPHLRDGFKRMVCLTFVSVVSVVVEKMTPKRKTTKTSAFGSPGRAGHDSSAFYAGKLYDGQQSAQAGDYIENPIPADSLDQIHCHSAETMTELPDCSVHLMVTSPPYNVGKEYDEDLSLEDYLAFLQRVWQETRRVLVPGGRMCINVANLGRKPYIPLHAFIAEQAVRLGFLMRGEIIWNKAASASPSTAWGSWKSASNPTLRDVHEYILVFCKDTFKRMNPAERPSTITRDEFLEYNKSVWNFKAESARKIGHPAPFPLELPRRLIQLYTFENEIVLDPFMGSGQTAIAVAMTNRHFVGYETDPTYVELANQRIKEMKP